MADGIRDALVARLQKGDVVFIRVDKGVDPNDVMEAMVRAVEKVGLQDDIALILADVDTIEVTIARGREPVGALPWQTVGPRPAA